MTKNAFTFFSSLLLLLLLVDACQQQSTGEAAYSTLNGGMPSSTDTIIPNVEMKDSIASEMKDDIKMTKVAVPTHSLTDNAQTDYLMGKFDPVKRKDFVSVGKPYTNLEGMMLRRETFEAFKKMWEAARRDGVHLNIISSTRTFYRQKEIWEGKWARYASETPDPVARAQRILEYSSMPGSSRHHWGTDIDLNDLENASFESGGKYEKVYQWLELHAYKFGFCQPYSPKGPERPYGYNEEKWHWSYLPLSQPLLKTYGQSIMDAQISGFQGAETAREIQIVKHYVQGINPECTAH